MNQNSTGPRDQAVHHQPDERHEPIAPIAHQGQAATAPKKTELTVSEPMMWRLVVPDDRIVLIPGDLCYRSTDPYAVCVTFRVHGDTLDWLFARTLLISGLHEPVGVGDVEISPCHRDAANTVQITLKARHAYAVLEAPTLVVADFLKRTCAAVPLGTEHRHLDLDELVSWLVRDTD